jgi:hypothetical protein
MNQQFVVGLTAVQHQGASNSALHIDAKPSPSSDGSPCVVVTVVLTQHRVSVMMTSQSLHSPHAYTWMASCGKAQAVGVVLGYRLLVSASTPWAHHACSLVCCSLAGGWVIGVEPHDGWMVGTWLLKGLLLLAINTSSAQR